MQLINIAPISYYSQPIPDYYSLTMEISRDRATVAHQNCEEGSRRYLECNWTRSLNQACRRLVSLLH